MNFPEISWKRGFSLVELMVVIAVLVALMAIAAPMWMTDNAAGVNSSTYRLSAFFDEARSKAVSLGQPVRILVNDDRATRGQYRRYVTAVQWEENGDDPGYWLQVLSPFLLNEGIYFDFKSRGTATATMPFSMGGLHGEKERNWRFYEIEGNGSPGDSTARNVVVGMGNFDETTMALTFPNQDVVGGFRISDTSRTVCFRSGDDIREANKKGGQE